jgi:GNAT superfamily N-acetyltransferase
MKNIKVKPVDKTTWHDFEKLFKSKGAPGYCWCMVWRMTNEELKLNTSANKKKFIRQRVRANTPIGLLAYDKTEPIGWCSIAPRETYHRLQGTLEKVWSIACFYVKREYRDQGFVDFLIDKAKKYAKRKGAKYLEAYPVKPSSPSYRFMGFVKSFDNAGFSFVKKAVRADM